jgi:hypothetical protein
MKHLEQPLNREEQVNEAIAAYLQAAEAGERPDPAEWLRRYPDLADNLASFFADRADVERRIASLCRDPVLWAPS